MFSLLARRETKKNTPVTSSTLTIEICSTTCSHSCRTPIPLGINIFTIPIPLDKYLVYKYYYYYYYNKKNIYIYIAYDCKTVMPKKFFFFF